jgi:hypothetical protein
VDGARLLQLRASKLKKVLGISSAVNALVAEVEALKPPKPAASEPPLMPRVSEVAAEVPISGTPLKVASDENAEESDFPMGTPNLYQLTPPLNMFKDSSSGGVSIDIDDDQLDQTTDKPLPTPKEETLADDEDEEDEMESLKAAFKALAAPHGEVASVKMKQIARECGFIGGRVTQADVDLQFARVKTRDQIRITFDQFLVVLSALAKRKGVPESDFKAAVIKRGSAKINNSPAVKGSPLNDDLAREAFDINSPRPTAASKTKTRMYSNARNQGVAEVRWQR